MIVTNTIAASKDIELEIKSRAYSSVHGCVDVLINMSLTTIVQTAANINKKKRDFVVQ